MGLMTTIPLQGRKKILSRAALPVLKTNLPVTLKTRENTDVGKTINIDGYCITLILWMKKPGCCICHLVVSIGPYTRQFCHIVFVHLVDE